MKRFLAYGFLALLTLFSCRREETTEFGGTLSIRFSTVGLQETKATTPGDGTVDDGGGIYVDGEGVPDLVILIANSITGHGDYGKIVQKYPTVGTLQSSSSTEAVIKFDFSALPAGEYTVYAFGNTEGLWDMTTDGEDTYSGATLTNLTTAAQVEALHFKPIDTAEGAGLQEGRLPVTAKASLTVSAGKNGEAYLELLRCVAKVTAIIVNNTGEAMNLYDYHHTVYGISPDEGYVIPHEEDVTGTPGNLVADPCTKYGNPDFFIPISASGSLPYNWYVFPSTGPYTIDIRFTLNKGGEGEKTYTYTDLPVTNWRAEDIPALGRNQHLTVTTRISKGLTVSFNFEVNEWTEHTASVEFD